MSSFGPNDQTKQAFGQLGSNTGLEAGYGNNLVNLGTQNTNSAGNFFRTLLNGNQANTTAMLQPDINRIQGANQEALQAATTLMPRGGGRSSTLFSLPFQTNQGIQSLYNQARTGGANALGQLGLGQANAGTSLFNSSNQAADALGQLGQNQQKIGSGLWGGLFKTALGIGLAPFTGGASLFV